MPDDAQSAPGKEGPQDGPLDGALFPTLEELGALLPQYEMQRIIGIGGMGAVYLARQSHLERWVALKVLPVAAAANPADAERFNAEARSMARLSHPHIVAVFEFGQTSAGHLYLAMEYVDGPDLHMRTLAGEITPERARHVMIQLCEALHYAHTQGVIHRDIKPANVLTTSDWQVKVVDFGLARDLAYAERAETEEYGTPEYTAPERLIVGQPTDHRADIYSLGVVIHELLTGKTPRAAGAQAGMGIPPEFAGVLSKCLMRDPARRYQSAQEVRQAILTATTPAKTQEVPAPPRPPTVRRMPPSGPRPPAHALTRSPAKNNAMGYAVACILIVLLLGLLVWRDHFSHTPPTREKKRPVAEKVQDAPPNIAQPDSSKPDLSGEKPGNSEPLPTRLSEIPSDMESNKVVSETVKSVPSPMNKAIPTALALAATTATAFSVDYKTQIEPIFRTKCYACHNAAKGKTKGDLALDPDKLSSVIGPGQHIVPGEPAKSTMLNVCKLPDDDSDVMPPKGKNRLTEAELLTFENWIKEGASLTGGAAPAPAVATTPAPAAGPQSWTSSDGKVVQANFVSLQGDLITLKTADGKTFTFPLSRLSAESQAQAKAAAGM
ncbi:Planctomycete cytochrome C [Prosthecobacter debontii]|uniref:Planctomycete cytochrome C n=1 Tax=Prosthecobacter debontii TaxID=48467 RepID=A0A1T4YQ58_9BACT|nr:serine/threonine-protein kinase [Prosthecobacter debontii]SKB03850.1 Planctomycete cytochrome C [Prosthecobacter debontii]